MKIVGLSPEEMAREEAEKAAFDALPLIEKNAIKLADLEREWSILGPSRSITFTVCFIEEEQANLLAQDARKEGFDVSIVTWASENTYRYELNATRIMEPTAENVTFWEDWFFTRAKNAPDFEEYDDYFIDGADFSGWSYPKTLRPAFLLEGDKRSKNYQNALGAQERTRILFGQTLCDFEASNGWASKKNSNSSPSFQLIPSEFVKFAIRRRPSSPGPTASNFSQWLYSLYASAFGDAQDRDEGKAAEEFILEERQRAYAATDSKTMRSHFSDWRLQFNGLHMAQGIRPNFYTIKDLRVRGEPLRVLPDLVYRNNRTGEVIIVEIKHSQMDIPSNLWPNIWGQLWCYAQIEEFRDAPKVTVVGEVWGDQWYSRGQVRYVYLRASVRRNPRAKAYDRFFRSLFDIYRGKN
ncbi:ribonuclease E inhibitor RraB [Phaeobacter gallaeciensis]|nr:ribonuclease E inhibitor RraB [Phaeobacter gallaeciensis]MDE4129773.1 ribonuclease E inhibitor RraB [Phaeobacter gallaeciensis]